MFFFIPFSYDLFPFPQHSSTSCCSFPHLPRSSLALFMGDTSMSLVPILRPQQKYRYMEIAINKSKRVINARREGGRQAEGDKGERRGR